MTDRKIILASQSPRRAQILEWAEVSFDVIVSDTDESYPDGLSPAEVAVHIALQKARAVSKRLVANDPGDTVLPIVAADTIVVLDGVIIGKPANLEDAKSTLAALSAREHTVITAVCILFNEKEVTFYNETLVEFKELSEQQISFYVHKYKPLDKAGAYAIQEWIGVVGIKCIKGDYYNVMGLPISQVIFELDKLTGSPSC